MYIYIYTLIVYEHIYIERERERRDPQGRRLGPGHGLLLQRRRALAAASDLCEEFTRLTETRLARNTFNYLLNSLNFSQFA